jgi:hypothetical protein
VSEPEFPCRVMDTRGCPDSYGDVCGPRPCARFESDNGTPWLTEPDREERPMTVPGPTVRPTAYAVSCLPPDAINADVFTITVEWRGPSQSRYAVTRMGFCLGTDGQWDHEPIPSSRTDEWLATHRFDLDTALRLATEHAPKIVVNGHTVADILAKAAS